MRLSIYFNLKTRIIDSYHIWENNEEVNIHEDEALLELDDATFVKIQPFKTKYINGELDFSENDTEELKKAIRFYININCFDIVNRGQVWYNTLNLCRIDT